MGGERPAIRRRSVTTVRYDVCWKGTCATPRCNLQCLQVPPTYCIEFVVLHRVTIDHHLIGFERALSTRRSNRRRTAQLRLN